MEGDFTEKRTINPEYIKKVGNYLKDMDRIGRP
jgi:hypothetical protein